MSKVQGFAVFELVDHNVALEAGRWEEKVREAKGFNMII